MHEATNTDDPVSAGGVSTGAKGESPIRPMSRPAKRGVDRGGGAGEGTRAGKPGLPFSDSADEGVRPLPRRPRRHEDWRDKHLRACVACGRVWRRRRRRTCPGCGSDRSICLTCDRAWPEDKIRPCPHPGEDVRRLVKACAGDWEWARRALAAAGGDLVRARVMVERQRPQGGGDAGGR